MYLFDRNYVKIGHESPGAALTAFVYEGLNKNNAVFGVDKSITPIVRHIAAAACRDFKIDFSEYFSWKQREEEFREALKIKKVTTLRSHTHGEFAVGASLVVQTIHTGRKCVVMSENPRWRVVRSIVGPTRLLDLRGSDEWFDPKKWSHVRNDKFEWLRVVQAQEGYRDINLSDPKKVFKEYYAGELVRIYDEALKDVGWYKNAIDTATCETSN